MKIKLLQITFILFLGFIATGARAQNVGINEDGSSPDASAILDVNSNNKGVLVPRMTTTEREAIASPAEGLMVFDSEYVAFFFYNGSAWQKIGVTTSGSSAEDVPTNPFLGQLYYDIASGKLFIYISSGWSEISLGTPISDPYGAVVQPKPIFGFFNPSMMTCSNERGRPQGIPSSPAYGIGPVRLSIPG